MAGIELSRTNLIGLKMMQIGAHSLWTSIIRTLTAYGPYGGQTSTAGRLRWPWQFGCRVDLKAASVAVGTVTFSVDFLCTDGKDDMNELNHRDGESAGGKSVC